MLIKNFLLGIIFITIFFSCEKSQTVDLKELKMNSKGSEINIYVTGGLTSQYTYHFITIQQPQSIFSYNQNEMIPVNNANVFVVSMNDTILFEYSNKGIYKTVNKVKAESNKKYTLVIQLNNLVYSASDSVEIVDTINLDEILIPDIEVYNNNYFLEIKSHVFGYLKPQIWAWYPIAWSNEDIVNYYFGSTKTYVHQGALPQGIFGTNVENEYTNQNFGTSETDSLYFIKFSLSQNYYNYLRAKIIETEWSESEFRTIQGNIPSNLSKGALGFFFVLNHKALKLTIKQLMKY